MLTDNLKTIIQNAYSHILESKNIKPRYGQRLMIADIARTLGNIEDNINKDIEAQEAQETEKEHSEHTHIATLEAGTGVGKTIAYLVAALPIAQEYKKKLVISTATIALQQQILFKDLPDIQQHSGLDFSFTLAKGRKRYVCLYKLESYSIHNSQTELDLDSPKPDTNSPELDTNSPEPDTKSPDNETSTNKLTNNKEDIKLYDKLFKAWKKKQWDGELDSWDNFIAQSSWLPLTSDHQQCSGKRCSFYNQCVYFKARESIFKVDCIIANHDLVLSDLNMGGGCILPAPGDCIYVFDEGHHLPLKAINHFSYSFQINSTLKWLEQLSATLSNFASLAKPSTKIQKFIENFPEQCKDINQEIKNLDAIVNQFNFPENKYYSPSGSNPERHKEQVYRFEFGQIPEVLRTQCQYLLKQFEKLTTNLHHINETLKETLDGDNTLLTAEIAEQWLPVLAPMHGRSDAAMNLFDFFNKKDNSTLPPNARWLTRISDKDNRDIELSCSPILAANTLQQILWSQCYGAIITSATITALGSFERFILNSGVSGFFNSVPSPFDYQKNVEFRVPLMNSLATEYQAHTDEVIDILKKIIDHDKGTLVLFSSKKQMNDVEYDLLRSDTIWKKQLLTQGQKNKQMIISDHKKQIDKGKGSVIFGLSSFAEGIDLPGEYCEHVIIAKLPFSVPNNPIDASLTEWIEAQGRNAFMEISVPDASIKLVQACGRLIRKETDSGQITLLDKRIITKFYGKKILDSLPPYTFTLNQPLSE